MTSIQPFHMLSSSWNDNVNDIQNFRSDSQWNETPVENISITEFCTHVTSWYYRAKKTQTQQDFWKENGLLHVICVPQWTLYKFIITVHPGDLSDLSAEVETITALLVYHNSLLADLSPSKKKFSFALSPEVTFHKGIFLKPVHTILLRTSINGNSNIWKRNYFGAISPGHFNLKSIIVGPDHSITCLFIN